MTAKDFAILQQDEDLEHSNMRFRNLLYHSAILLFLVGIVESSHSAAVIVFSPDGAGTKVTASGTTTGTVNIVDSIVSLTDFGDDVLGMPNNNYVSNMSDGTVDVATPAITLSLDSSVPFTSAGVTISTDLGNDEIALMGEPFARRQIAS